MSISVNYGFSDYLPAKMTKKENFYAQHFLVVEFFFLSFSCHFDAYAILRRLLLSHPSQLCSFPFFACGHLPLLNLPSYPLLLDLFSFRCAIISTFFLIFDNMHLVKRDTMFEILPRQLIVLLEV